jgi:hypothetical protein
MIYWQGKTTELGEKSVPVPLCPAQIPHGLTRARNRASAVWGRRLTTWAMARPSLVVRGIHVLRIWLDWYKIHGARQTAPTPPASIQSSREFSGCLIYRCWIMFLSRRLYLQVWAAACHQAVESYLCCDDYNFRYPYQSKVQRLPDFQLRNRISVVTTITSGIHISRKFSGCLPSSWEIVSLLWRL